MAESTRQHELVDAPVESIPVPSAHGSLGTAEQRQSHVYDTFGTDHGSGAKVPAQQHSYNPAESSSDVYQLPDGSQDQSAPQYAVVDEGGGGGPGDPEYASVGYAHQDVGDTSSITGDHGVYVVPSLAGNRFGCFYGCFLVIEAHGGTWFRTPCPMQVVRVAEDEFC